MERQVSVLIFVMFANSLAYGQDINEKDSLKIVRAVGIVIHNFENPDYNKFEDISTEVIYCILCDGTLESKLDPYVIYRKDFFENHLTNITNFESWKRATTSEELRLIREESKRSDITAYLTTWKKDEWVKGHEGAELGLYFKKVDGEYRFAGIETIP